jgi:hypothetical protein
VYPSLGFIQGPSVYVRRALVTPEIAVAGRVIPLSISAAYEAPSSDRIARTYQTVSCGFDRVIGLYAHPRKGRMIVVLTTGPLRETIGAIR